MTLGEIASVTGGRLVGADPSAAVTGPVEYDSRRIGPGGLFVAFPGEHVDGHEFAAAAVDAGATGVLGTRDTGKRPSMGAAAARGADLVVVTDDNPRTEDPAAIRAAVRAGAEQAGTAAKILEMAGRRAAIDEAVRLAGAGDVIALLGKGHERGQEIGGEVYPFDDRVELAAALSTRFGESS